MRTWCVSIVATMSLACGSGGTGEGTDVGGADSGPPDSGQTDPGPALDTGESLDSGDADMPWPWPTCPEWSEGAMSLKDKTAYLDQTVRQRHIDDNLIRTLRLDDEGNVLSRDHQPSTGLWTAIYLASQSLRYAVTGEQEALENARVAVKGLHDLTAVTGRPGLYGRAYDRPDFTYTQKVAGAQSWVASPAPGYEGWWFNDDVSKDTMDGIMFGYAVALEFVDDEDLKEDVRQAVLGFVEPLIEAGLQIIDHTGEVTLHGRLFYSSIDEFPGFNALLSMSWVRTAVDAGGSPDLVHFYEDCLLRLGDWTDCPEIDQIDMGSYLDAFDQFLHMYRPDCKTSYDNIDMIFHAIFPLLRREKHPDVRKRLLDKLNVGIWVPEEGNEPPLSESTHALYTFLYGALAEPPADDQVFRQAVDDAVCTLYRLEKDRYDKTTVKGQQEVACYNRLGDPNAAEVIPLEQRRYDNYLWRLDPYEIPEDKEGVENKLYSPEDYLLAYWVGRYFGFVSEEM